jgi:hypothetical protein
VLRRCWEEGERRVADGDKEHAGISPTPPAQVIAKAGQGAFGSVYVAMWKGMVVAVKVGSKYVPLLSCLIFFSCFFHASCLMSLVSCFMFHVSWGRHARSVFWGAWWWLRRAWWCHGADGCGRCLLYLLLCLLCGCMGLGAWAWGWTVCPAVRALGVHVAAAGLELAGGCAGGWPGAASHARMLAEKGLGVLGFHSLPNLARSHARGGGPGHPWGRPPVARFNGCTPHAPNAPNEPLKP